MQDLLFFALQHAYAGVICLDFALAGSTDFCRNLSIPYMVLLHVVTTASPSWRMLFGVGHLTLGRVGTLIAYCMDSVVLTPSSEVRQRLEISICLSLLACL